MNYTVRLYEKDSDGNFWPAGQYTYDGKVKAIRALESFVGGEVSGIVTNREHVAAFRNMSRSECLRVSPIKIIATGLVSR